MREGLDWIQRSITDRRARPFQENTFAIRHRKSGQAPIAVDICKDGIAAIRFIRESRQPVPDNIFHAALAVAGGHGKLRDG
jgi:hypothetical protein